MSVEVFFCLECDVMCEQRTGVGRKLKFCSPKHRSRYHVRKFRERQRRKKHEPLFERHQGLGDTIIFDTPLILGEKQRREQ